MDLLYTRFGKEILITYHVGEELVIGLICLSIAWRAFLVVHSGNRKFDRIKESRIFLVSSSFIFLGISSLLHAAIHALGLNLNLLYQTLIGYCFGLMTLIAAISAEKSLYKKTFPLLYLLLLPLLLPVVYERFPIFGEFRPLVWIIVAYLSGVVCILYIATYYRTKRRRFLYSAGGHALICMSSVFLFFPASIGSSIWLHGHIFRPTGFLILFFSMNKQEISRLESSILYRTLTAFCLLAAIPLLTFGTFVFYENIHPIDISGQRLLIFSLMFITLAGALIFGLGMIIRLIRPILQLKESVNGLVDEGLDKKISVWSNDEIGELSNAFNEMIGKLRHAIDEQNRLCSLAATGELAATLAHEIKNPLNAIGGAATYIKDNTKGSLIKEFVKIILDEVSRINKLTATLMNFANPTKLQLAPHDINKIIYETINLLNQEARELDITITTSTADNIPLVNCDYNQIKQILLNLLLNSFDAIGKNGMIKIITQHQNGNVLLSIEDNGEGIKSNDIHQVFNPFFTTKTRGTGLGLAISKRIAKEHGGDLSVKSTYGQGATFILLLKSEK